MTSITPIMLAAMGSALKTALAEAFAKAFNLWPLPADEIGMDA